MKQTINYIKGVFLDIVNWLNSPLFYISSHKDGGESLEIKSTIKIYQTIIVAFVIHLIA